MSNNCKILLNYSVVIAFILTMLISTASLSAQEIKPKNKQTRQIDPPSLQLDAGPADTTINKKGIFLSGTVREKYASRMYDAAKKMRALSSKGKPTSAAPSMIKKIERDSAILLKVSKSLNKFAIQLKSKAELRNIDLQNMLQKQQQTLQTISNVSKARHDTAKAIIQNMK